jgi:hypothetical protein
MMRAGGGDFARLAERAALERVAGKGLAFREALTLKLMALRRELAGPDPSPVVRRLADRVALCWLDGHDGEVRHHQATTEAFRAGAGGLSWRQHEHYQRMRDRAHRRPLQALKTLAQVQKLGPALQIHLAKVQVHQAGGVARHGPAGPASPPPDRGAPAGARRHRQAISRNDFGRAIGPEKWPAPRGRYPPAGRGRRS